MKMKKLLTAIALISLVGCASNPHTKYRWEKEVGSDVAELDMQECKTYATDMADNYNFIKGTEYQKKQDFKKAQYEAFEFCVSQKGYKKVKK